MDHLPKVQTFRTELQTYQKVKFKLQEFIGLKLAETLPDRKEFWISVATTLMV